MRWIGWIVGGWLGGCVVEPAPVEAEVLDLDADGAAAEVDCDDRDPSVGIGDCDWPAHIDLAEEVVDQITPEHNVYGTPSAVEWVEGEWVATTVCGGFVAWTLTSSYPNLDEFVLNALTGSASPDSATWYAAILAEPTFSLDFGEVTLRRRAAIGDVARGDLFASAYEDAGGTGHSAIVADLRLDVAGLVDVGIPGVPLVDRYVARLVDATASIHGDYAGTTDSRYLAEDIEGGAVHDVGIGTGEIYLFADPVTGEIVGWSWSAADSSPVRQGVDATADAYAPVAIGVFDGPGF